MITLEKITIFELPNLVAIAYEDDKDLFDKYHVAKMNMDDCVDSTLMMIEQTGRGEKMDYFGVKFKDEFIGYLVILPKILYSFGINIKYRKKEILMSFWESIKDILNDSFICMLYPNNTRAINWLKKNKMIIVDEVREDCVTLLNI